MKEVLKILRDPYSYEHKNSVGFIFSYELKDIIKVISKIEEAMKHKTCEWKKTKRDGYDMCVCSCGAEFLMPFGTTRKDYGYIYCSVCGGKIKDENV